MKNIKKEHNLSTNLFNHCNSIRIIFYSLMFFWGLSLMSCGILRSDKYWKIEQKRISEIRSRWIYKELTTEIKGKVLLFREPFGFDLTWYPAFTIIQTTEQDTVIVLDKELKTMLKKGEFVNVEPLEWSELEKECFGTAYFPIKKTKINKILASVKVVYYGKIKIQAK